MENIRVFAETIKGIQMSQIIDIGIAILIYILFRCLSKSLAYMTVRIFKPKTKNKKEIRENAFYTPSKSILCSIRNIFSTIICKKTTKYRRMDK